MKNTPLHGIQLEVPNSPFALLRNGPRKIEEGTIFKIRLFPVLHFYDNTFTGIGYAIDVVDKTLVLFLLPAAVRC